MKVFDLGMTSAQRTALQEAGVACVTPAWDFSRFPDPGFGELPIAQRRNLPRPFLTEYFPGYDVYLWLDADTWVQDERGLDEYVEGALREGFAITSEWHECYAEVDDKVGNIADFHARVYAEIWGAEVARALARHPVLNSGVFAAKSDAPHWGLWQRLMIDRISSRRRLEVPFMQTALNVLLRSEGVRCKVLSARCNWLCNVAEPMLLDDGSAFVVPREPFEPLLVVHALGKARDWLVDHTFRTPRGGYRNRSIGYLPRGNAPST